MYQDTKSEIKINNNSKNQFKNNNKKLPHVFFLSLAQLQYEFDFDYQ